VRKASSNSPPHQAPQVSADRLGSPPDELPAEVMEAFAGISRSGQGVSPHLFFHIVQRTPVAVSITDADASILCVNRAFETLTGYHRLEIIGQNESILSNKATPAKVYRDLWRTIRSKATWTGTLVSRRKNGEAYLAELIIAPVLNAAGDIAN
jgi:PAS domain S-box-containing protein